MSRLRSRSLFPVVIARTLLAALQAQAVPLVVDYNVATTGQSARAPRAAGTPLAVIACVSGASAVK